VPSQRRLLAGASPALALGVLWGFNWPAVKTILVEVPPWTARTAGLSCGAATLFAIAALRGDSLRVPRAHWPRLFAAAFCTIAAFNILVAYAQLGAPTSRVTIVTFMMPIWATLLAALIIGERIDRRRAFGLALGVAGLAALSAPLWRLGALPLGVVLALFGGMAWALGTVIAKRWPVSASSLAVAAWQLAIGAAVVAVGMAFVEGWPRVWPTRPQTWAAFAYHVALAQALAYWLWFAVVARRPASVAAIGTLIIPVVGFLSSMALLGETPTLADAIGLTLITLAAASVLAPAPRS
jgi:drug/metabolite transporter (DMT)-like permease